MNISEKKSGKIPKNLNAVPSAVKTSSSKNQLNAYLKKNLFVAFHKIQSFCQDSTTNQH